MNPANGVTAIWGDNIFFVAAVKYTAASLDMSYVPMLQRMKTWFKNTCVLHATGTLTALNLPKVYDQWSPASPGLPSIHQCWAMIDALSYSAVLFSDQDDLNVATELFESTVRYWQIPPDVVATYNILDPDSFSRIAMRPLQFPQSESKVLGEILHFGNSHIAARSLFAGVW